MLSAFLYKSAKDTRISIAHIGLYATLLEIRRERGFTNPLRVYSREIKPVARISSSATYHRLIRDLDAFGYLRYSPSFYKGKPSTIIF